MLSSLQISNIAVMRGVDIEFGPGFCVLTGETGAGKSIIIDSIGLLLGGKASRELIRSGEDSACVAALFENITDETRDVLIDLGIDCPDRSLLLRRTLSTDGRGTARVNGQTVTLAMLREIGGTLIGIHGQHDNQRIMQKASHIRLLDAYAGSGAKLAGYDQIYREMKEMQRELDSLRSDAAEKIRLRDMLIYQINEINSAKLKPGEEEELTAERMRLQHAEKIKRQTTFAYRALHGSEKGAVTLLLERSTSAISALADVLPEAGELASRLEGFRYEIEDIAQTVRGLYDAGDGDPTTRLDRIEGRLEQIARLTRKYGSDIPNILHFRDEAAERLEKLENSDIRTEELTERLRALERSAREAAAEISAVRRKNAAAAAREVCAVLTYLDMPGVKFEIKVSPASQLKPDGADEVEFFIAANPGEPPLPLVRTASGGELSRIMLALKCVLSANDGISTMIFDEVDAGISGKTSRKVGIKLREIAREVQVLCVTHSAQIASLADEHMLITKSERDGRAETAVKTLDMDGRINEIARILGGINITDTQRDAAREMIEDIR